MVSVLHALQAKPLQEELLHVLLALQAALLAHQAVALKYV